jgi:hypothetical protein
MTAIDQADASPALPVPRRGLSAVIARDWGVLLSAGVWIVLVVNFSALALVTGDEEVQLTFVKRLFGDAPRALGYFFGLGLVEAPFYALGKLLDAAGLDTVAGHPVEETVIALGLGLLTVAAWPLLATVLRGLSLGHAGFAILAAALGTPFFYYATFVPGKNHALDGLLFCAAIYLVFRYFRADTPERWVPYALGALYGLACAVRYFNGAELALLLLLLVVWRRYRHAAEIALTASVAFLLLMLIPRALGVPVFSHTVGGNYTTTILVFAPLNPLRMLFTDHRGYFVWAPVAALAVPGLVLLFRRRPEHRRFLTTIVAMGLGLVAAYAFVPFWDGTWAFGQRFYTPLFPLVAIGLAGLLDAAPRLAGAAAAVAVSWTLFLCFNLVTIGGPQYLKTTPGGVEDLALVPVHTDTSPGAYGFGVWHKSNLLRPLFAWPFGTQGQAVSGSRARPSGAGAGRRARGRRAAWTPSGPRGASG